jgi:hypothetical protein
MQVTPAAAPQQSALVVHFSEMFEQVPDIGGLQTFGDAGSFGSEGRQKPSQHSSPVSQFVPSAWQGSSAQKPRSLRVDDWFGR